MEDDDMVLIHVSNQRGYIWSPEEVATLRSKHHLTGILIGTLPSISQQNVFLGLPLLLLPEEVVLLVENRVALIVDDNTSHRPATPAQLAAWNEARIHEAEAQINQDTTALKPGSEEAKQKGKGSEAAARKRAEREARREAQAAQAALAASQDPLFAPDSSKPLEDDSKSTLLAAHTVRIASTSADLPWYDPKTYSTISSAREAGVWSFPETQADRARCGVFRDLSEKGYFMGGGMRFGGDWLVYPGDPLRYHSHFVATVYPQPTSELRPMDIVALGRLGTATKKAHLLCGWDDEKGAVDYYSIEWAGFG